MRLSKLHIAALGMALMSAGIARGQIVDNMDTTANFTNPFGNEQIQANGDGTVSITRGTASVDAGINWIPNGQNVPIPGNELLTVTPVAAINGGYWVPTILLFDSSGNFLHEVPWLGDTNTTQAQTVNIANLATTDGYSNAGQYYLRLRMDPYVTQGAGFTFTQISTAAAPEPGSIGLIAAGALGIIARRRRAAI